MSDVWITVITALGGYTVVLAALIGWFGTRLLQSALAKQKGEIEKDVNEHNAALLSKQETELAELRAKLDVEASVRNLLMNSVSNTRPQIFDKRMSSIEALWASLFAFRDSLPPFLTYVDIIMESEFADWIHRTDVEDVFGDLSMDKITKLATSTTADIERVRPFVGEYLWSVFFAYRAFLMRIVVFVFFERTKGQPSFWKTDQGVNQILKSVLSDSEMSHFNEKQIGAIQYARTLIEARFISQVEKILSGQSSIQEGLEQAQRIMAATEAARN